MKNEIKDAEQGRDVVMSDVFKTLRDPLIEQQKKTDAKQDAVIDQLKANQLALTGGLRDLVESNRDVLTLQQELPFPSAIEERSGEKPKEKTLIAEPNNLFTERELKFIKDEGLIEPNKLLNLEKGKLNILEVNVKGRRNALSREIGTFKRLKNPSSAEQIKDQQNEKTSEIFLTDIWKQSKCCRLFPNTKKDQEFENINNPKETLIRFLIHPLEIFLLMFPN